MVSPRSCSVITPVNYLSADSWVVVPVGMLSRYSYQRGQKDSSGWEGMITRDPKWGGELQRRNFYWEIPES